MRIVIIGAGIIGLTAAGELAARGHDVTLIDKLEGVGRGASYANGSQLSFSYVDPFAAPGLIWKLAGILLGRDPGISARLNLIPAQMMWNLSMLRHSSWSHFSRSLKSLIRLAALSSELTRRMLHDLNLMSSVNQNGKLVVYPDSHTLASYRPIYELKRQLGADVEMLTTRECLEREPGIAAWEQQIGGGIFSASDFAADSFRVGELLAQRCRDQQGVQIVLGKQVDKIVCKNQSVTSVIVDEASIPADAVVLSAGAESESLGRSVGLRLGIEAIHGFSFTAPARPGSLRASVTTVADRMVFSNLNGHLRVAGYAHIGKLDSRIEDRYKARLLAKAQKLLPDAADYAKSTNLWCGRRPARPNSLPLISNTPIDGLFLNTGHGSYGWTLACGSANMLADIVEQKTPQVNPDFFKYKHQAAL